MTTAIPVKPRARPLPCMASIHRDCSPRSTPLLPSPILRNSSSGPAAAGSPARTARASCTASSEQAASMCTPYPTRPIATIRPSFLCGADKGPTPVEWVLHALASCLTAGIANIAAARGIKLSKVESIVGIDLRGILRLSKEVRKAIRASRSPSISKAMRTPLSLSRSSCKSKARSVDTRY